MRPPFQITPVILANSSEIARLCGQLQGWSRPVPKPELRRTNRVRSIQGSLSIEGNTLSLEQVSAVLEGKRVLGPKKDILEVRNAIQAYEQLDRFDAFSPKSFLKAHQILMNGLVDDPGRWRQGQVGIQKGKNVVHVAPPPGRVPELMEELFRFARSEKNVSLLIVSCVFHYEAAFIHPFMDGNGRMARLWQTALLKKHDSVFSHVPVESVVKRKQREYYKALAGSDRLGASTPFVEFMLSVIQEALQEYVRELEVPAETPQSRLEKAGYHFQGNLFSRKDYLEHFKTVSTATASRDLREGVEAGLLTKTGDKNKTRYYYRKTHSKRS